MEDDSVRVLDKCMLEGNFDETKERILQKLKENETLRDLSDKIIQEGVDKMVERNPEHWMKDRKAFEKVKLEVEESIMRAIDVEIWTMLEEPAQRDEIVRQLEEALGSTLTRR